MIILTLFEFFSLVALSFTGHYVMELVPLAIVGLFRVRPPDMSIARVLIVSQSRQSLYPRMMYFHIVLLFSICEHMVIVFEVYTWIEMNGSEKNELKIRFASATKQVFVYWDLKLTNLKFAKTQI